MKHREIFSIIFTYMLFLLCLTGCENVTDDNTAIEGGMTAWSGCLDRMDVQGTESDDFSRDCIYWNYSSDRTLVMVHQYAAFNCCPGDIDADITMDGSAITISEYSTEAACKCNCLYRLDYAFPKLHPGRYTFQFEEPLRWQDDPVLEFSLDLEFPGSGTFCVSRTRYPWR
ncbi:hypothetical protein JW979_14115 [bacterium]|nr:hypothetical protein [candidate division CSSED10-310 bacterium]